MEIFIANNLLRCMGKMTQGGNGNHLTLEDEWRFLAIDG